MSNFDTTTESVLRNVEWTNVADASGPILRRAALGAVVQEARLELGYDWDRGEYELHSTGAVVDLVDLEPAF